MTKKLKMLLVSVLVFSFAFSGVSIANELRREIKVLEAMDLYLKYNGDEFIARDANDKVVYPILHNGTTYLPVRAVAGIAGLKVDWDGETRTVLLTSSDYVVVSDDGYVEEQEINDIKVDANLIEDVTNGKVKGRVGEMLSTGKDNKDLFKFVLPENGVFSFDITGNKSAIVNVSILDDESGYDLVHFFSGADPNGMYNGKLALRAGVYYIELDGSSEEMPYKIDTSFRATPDDFEVDDSESDAKVFDFNGSQFINQGAVGIGNDIYSDYIVLDNFNSMTYNIDFAWQAQKYDYVYMTFYDDNGYALDQKQLTGPDSSSQQVVTESVSGQLDTAIDKIAIQVVPYAVGNICTEYTITIEK